MRAGMIVVTGQCELSLMMMLLKSYIARVIVMELCCAFHPPLPFVSVEFASYLYYMTK